MRKQFVHEGKEFEIRRIEIDDAYHVSVHCGNKQVGPTYSVSKEIEGDYRVQAGGSMVGELEEIAQKDVERGFYICRVNDAQEASSL